MSLNLLIRPADASDLANITDLLPELADFDVPIKRNREDLWRSDLELLKRILNQDSANSFCDVACDSDAPDRMVGVVIVTMRDELLSGSPSAHLEAIVIDKECRGYGLGRKLLQHAETKARELGAESISLHVFSNNHRARSLYAGNGYDEELIRAIRWLS